MLCCKQELAKASEARAKLLDELAMAYEKVQAKNECLKSENKRLKDSVELLDQNLKASHDEDTQLRYHVEELERENAKLTQSLDEAAGQLRRCSDNCKVLAARNKSKYWSLQQVLGFSQCRRERIWCFAGLEVEV